MLKILTLAGCEQGEIAARTGLDAGVVETWERLFFDVRDLRASLGWVLAQVFRPEQAAGRAALAAKLKMARALGPAGAQAILDGETRVPTSAAQRLFDRNLKLSLKFEEAVELPLVTPQDKLRFVKIYTDLQMKERRLQLEERKLQVRIEEGNRRRELAKLRLEAARARAAVSPLARLRWSSSAASLDALGACPREAEFEGVLAPREDAQERTGDVPQEALCEDALDPSESWRQTVPWRSELWNETAPMAGVVAERVFGGTNAEAGWAGQVAPFPPVRASARRRVGGRGKGAT